ncbi:glutamate receptor ionotropic, kainate 5-like [Copidosoma floridanum]|uniref:glutamate receptor ionotropic, kainate 5-like n=1 Tax=Copidosoma floridanum TaxID=29053 RepID=UPI0006C98FE5|nr:glutamate receptor ionotropic, kainate 5-like [Copidosoma floridanum]
MTTTMRTIVTVLLMCWGAGTVAGVYFNDDLVLFVSDVQEHTKASSVVIVYAGDDQSLNTTSLMQLLLRKFSSKFVPSLTLNYSDVLRHHKSYRQHTTKPLFVVLITSYQELHMFQRMTGSYDMSYPSWLLVFTSETSRMCYRPSGNSFNLAFDTEMLVKCYNDPTVREWYSVRFNETSIYELITWTPERGLRLMSKKSFYERRNNLGGMSLSVVTVGKVPENGSHYNHNFYSSVLNELSKSLNFTLNFTCTEKFGGTYNKSENKWTGAIGRLERGEVELGASEFTMTENRLGVIDFSFPIMISRSKIYVQQPDGSAMNLYSYFKVYHINVWLSIKFTYIMASLVVTILRLIIKGKSLPYGHVSENFLSIWGILWQQGLPELPKETSVRIAYYVVLLEAALLTAIYSACLISYLAVTRPSLPFSDLKGLANDGSYKVLTLRESADYEFFQTSTNEEMEKIRTLMPESNSQPLSKEVGFQRVCEGKNAFFTTGHVKNLAHYKIPCDVIPLDTKRIGCFSITMRKRSPYKGLINYYLLKFIDNGLIKRLRSQVYRKVYNRDKKYKPMNIASVIFIFLVLSIGFTCSLMILCCEVFAHKANLEWRSRKTATISKKKMVERKALDEVNIAEYKDNLLYIAYLKTIHHRKV